MCPQGLVNLDLKKVLEISWCNQLGTMYNHDVNNCPAKDLYIVTKYKVDSRQPHDKVPQTTSISVYFVIAICTWIGHNTTLHYITLHYNTQKTTQ